MQCPQYIIPRTKLWEQLWAVGIKEIDYDKIISYPQATRYVYMMPEEDNDDEPVGLAAMDLGVEDDEY
ncbi:hypothetical protein N7491_007954 [Penicillium cf. griseofulvum]|nr:hypothetical protein N7491_007954 [Penicillium cf. griseofulvum]KAJ5431713.1 hypothetical protein N7445_008211 [Penicillium cf. griseofulvum]